MKKVGYSHSQCRNTTQLVIITPYTGVKREESER